MVRPSHASEPAAPASWSPCPLTRAVWHRWPDTPPNAGQFPDITPHPTIADGQPSDLLDAVSDQIGPRPPIGFTADALTVLTFDGSRWRELARIPLG